MDKSLQTKNHHIDYMVWLIRGLDVNNLVQFLNITLKTMD